MLLLAVAFALALAVAVWVTTDYGSLAGALAFAGVMIVYGLIARENQSRKVNGEPPLIGFRKRTDDDD